MDKLMRVPALQECYELFEQYKVPRTVRAHCGMVYQVASSLAQQLIKQGYPLHLEIIKPFALLHDCMKAVVLERLDGPPYNYKPTAEELTMHAQLRAQYTGRSETDVAHEILSRQYPEFAQLFLELDQLTHNPRAKVSAEARFIHYVDWRVLGKNIVSLQKRMDYIYERYGHWMKRKGINWEVSKQEQYDYERTLFQHLPFHPEELEHHVKLSEVLNYG